jgi:hypothetical protein
MSLYVPFKVSNKRHKQLTREGGGFIFHRIDKNKQAWVKAASEDGERLMNSYGINARQTKS